MRILNIYTEYFKKNKLIANDSQIKIMEEKSNLQILKELCPSLEKELLEEIIDTFENFAETNFDEDDDEEDLSTQMSSM